MTRGKFGAGSAVWSRRALLLLSLAAMVRPVRASDAVVEIRQFKFTPAELEIKAGDAVAFVNLDLVPHTATGDGFDTGPLKKGERAEIAFSNPGAFDYVCRFHPHMKGRILVR